MALREDLKDQNYYLDSLIQKSQEETEIYFTVYLLKSELQRKKKKNVEALNSLKRIIESPEAAKYSEILGIAYLATCDLYLAQKSFDLAQNYVAEAYTIFKALPDSANQAISLIKSATINKAGQNYQAAIRDLKQAHDIYESLKKSYETTELAREVGTVAYAAGEFLEAKEYLAKALDGYTSSNEYEEQIQVLETLAFISEFEKNFSAQLSHQEKLVELSRTNASAEESAARLEDLRSIYVKFGRTRDALKSQEEAVNFLENNQSAAKYYALLKLSELYSISNRQTDAVVKLHEAYRLANSLDDKDILIQSSKVLADFYEEINEWEKAVYYLSISDSISTQTLLAKIDKLKADSGNKEGVLIDPQELADSDTRTSFLTDWKNYLGALCVCFLVLVIVLVVNGRKAKKITKILEWKVYKRTKELRVLNSELNTYIYKSSHDLRNPLTSIKSLITLLKSEQNEESRNKYLDLIEDCAIQMDEILLNLSRAVDYKKFEVTPVQVDFNSIKDELANFEFEENSGIEILWNIREKAPFFSDPNLIKVILSKTILNSKQYRLGSSKDFCKVSITTDSSGAYLCIEDNGQGISDKVKNSVFDMFVKGTHKSKGAGLGLYLVKIAADKLRGNITLESQENKGSKLVFKLPNLV
ncbi:MAG: ATP-binding protein [Flavobacteriales bacterium]